LVRRAIWSWCTRECVNNILNGNIQNSRLQKHSVFDLEYAVEIGDIPLTITDPIRSWTNPLEYNQTAVRLRDMFEENSDTYA
jgi:ATP-dependent phosphoenolpyruvate carboxykinase